MEYTVIAEYLHNERKGNWSYLTGIVLVELPNKLRIYMTFDEWLNLRDRQVAYKEPHNHYSSSLDQNIYS